MTWNNPHDFIDAELVTPETMDNISENLTWLKTPPADQVVIDDAANYTKSGTAWADINASLNVEVVTAGGAVMVHGHFPISNNATGQNTYLDLDLDTNGTAIGRIGTEDGICMFTSPVGGYVMTISFTRRITGLAAGTHVFTPQWKVGGGTATLWTGVTAAALVHGQLWAVEMG